MFLNRFIIVALLALSITGKSSCSFEGNPRANVMRASSNPQSVQMIVNPSNLFFGYIPSDVAVKFILPLVDYRELNSLLATSRGTRYATLKYYGHIITNLKEMCDVVGPEQLTDKNLQAALLMRENPTLPYMGTNFTQPKQMLTNLVFKARGYERRSDNTGGLSGLQLSIARKLVKQFVSMREKLKAEGPGGLSDIELVVDKVFPQLLRLKPFRFDGEGDVPVKPSTDVLEKRGCLDSPPDMSNLENALQAMSKGCHWWPKYLGRYYFPLDSLDRIRHIEELSLDLCLLDPLPLCMGQLKHLKSLELSCSRSTSVLPNWVWKLYNLEKLKIEGGSFSSLPNELERLKKLKELSVLDCNLFAIDPCIRSLPNLQRLLLSGNQIRDIPEWLVGKERLLFVDLDRNPVQLPQNSSYDSNPSAISASQLSIKANNQLYYFKEAEPDRDDHKDCESESASSNCCIF